MSLCFLITVAQQLPLCAALSSEEQTLVRLRRMLRPQPSAKTRAMLQAFPPSLRFPVRERELSHCDLQMTWYSRLRNFELTFSALHGFRNGFQRRQWHPTPVPLPGKSHGRRSLVGCSSWSWTRLSGFTFTFHFHALEKEMATHSSVLAWRIPGTGEPGGLPSMGSHRVRHD